MKKPRKSGLLLKKRFPVGVKIENVSNGLQRKINRPSVHSELTYRVEYIGGQMSTWPVFAWCNGGKKSVLPK